MITVIIAGGSGTRLWPLSTPNNPKQLLSLTNEKTMVQNTYARAKLLSEDVYLIPDISHADALKTQLPEVDDDYFIVEPGRRGTANCIVAALVHVAKRHDKDEPIAFIHADHHIRDSQGFALSFEEASEASTKRGEIVLIGIEPTYPATGFGYIERNGELEDIEGAFRVKSFKEKPDFNTANEYMASGRYLWNCGYFVGSVNTFLGQMETYAPELKENYDTLSAIDDEQKYAETYLAFENEVIDVALIEKSPSLIVVPAGFDWMDVGNFSDLHDANQSDENKNHFRGDNIHDIEVENAFIRNEEPDKHVAVIGLDNIVVINTKDGILVARKDISLRVGEIAKKIQK
ncbi:MAG: mannose-phosphate guanylyltransferase [Candidatus Saccharibacteria bacterium]|nr:mannose-phosphate guanylyltransferase [Candidatus Saccharibacteria bacterium]